MLGHLFFSYFAYPTQGLYHAVVRFLRGLAFCQAVAADRGVSFSVLDLENLDLKIVYP